VSKADAATFLLISIFLLTPLLLQFNRRCLRDHNYFFRFNFPMDHTQSVTIRNSTDHFFEEGTGLFVIAESARLLNDMLNY